MALFHPFSKFFIPLTACILAFIKFCNATPSAEYQPQQLRKILTYLQKAIDEQCDILILPEYSTSSEIVEALTTAQGSFWEKLPQKDQDGCKLLQKSLKSKILIAGSYSQQSKKYLYNTCSIVAFGKSYLQNKLCPTQKEQALISGGNNLLYFVNSGWGDFVVAICYDFMTELFDSLQNKIDHLFVIARNLAVERFRRDYALPRCNRLYTFVSIVNDVHKGGGSEVYAPYSGNCSAKSLGWHQEDLLLVKCPMIDMDKSRQGKAIGDFHAPPPGITPRHIPLVHSDKRTIDCLGALIGSQTLTVSPETEEDGSILLYVNNISAPRISTRGYSLELSDYFVGEYYPKGRRIKEQDAWNKTLLPQIQKLKQHLDEQNIQKQLKIEIFARLSIGFALGYVFSAPSGYNLQVYQGNHFINKTQLWYAGDEPIASEMSVEFAKYDPKLSIYQKITGIWQEKTQELVVMISIAQKLVADVEKYLTRSKLNCHHLLKFIPKDGAERTAISSSAQAIGIAYFIGEQLRKYRSEHGFDKIHLFYAGPLALAIFIGQNLNACGPVQIYEHQEPSYAPSFLLKS